MDKQLALAILYFPSPLFWGGGVSKDTYTYMGTALFIISTNSKVVSIGFCFLYSTIFFAMLFENLSSPYFLNILVNSSFE